MRAFSEAFLQTPIARGNMEYLEQPYESLNAKCDEALITHKYALPCEFCLVQMCSECCHFVFTATAIATATATAAATATATSSPSSYVAPCATFSVEALVSVYIADLDKLSSTQTFPLSRNAYCQSASVTPCVQFPTTQDIICDVSTPVKCVFAARDV